MIVVKIVKKVQSIITGEDRREQKTRKYTRHMIKKYGKTLRRLSYE
jgi:hypothetical protein